MADHRPLIQASLRAALENTIGKWIETHSAGHADPKEISTTLLALASAVLNGKLPIREAKP